MRVGLGSGVRVAFAPAAFGLTLTALGLSLTTPCFAWSLSKELVRPSLLAAREEVRACALEHALVDGRYAFWIVVAMNGRGRAEVRQAPAKLEPDARRCLERAFERQTYPTALEATVAWSASSPPGMTYSISYPIELRVQAYGFDSDGDPLRSGGFAPARVRPKPARSRWISAERRAR